jgi:hypothetical protein
MNVWLHKQVMRKLAENGGKVPDDLKDSVGPAETRSSEPPRKTARIVACAGCELSALVTWVH